MNAKTTKGYLLVIPIGLVLIAAFVLVALQWANRGDFSFYGKNLTGDTAAKTGPRTIYLIGGGIVFGIILLPLLKWFFRGIGALRRGRQQSDLKRAAEVGEQTAAQKPAEQNPPAPHP